MSAILQRIAEIEAEVKLIICVIHDYINKSRQPQLSFCVFILKIKIDS